jgi:hypothetical protein
MFNWPSVQQKKPGTFATWKDDPASTAALWWELNVRRGREAGASLGPELYHEMRYESLVAHPERDCAALCAFLGLPYDECMLRFHEARANTDEGLTAGHGWRPITPGARDWRTQMAPADVERFEAAAGDLLEELGYARAFPESRPEAVAHSIHVRNRLANEPRDVRPYGLA